MLPLSWFAGIIGPPPLYAALFFSFIGLAVNGAISLFIIYSNILDEEFGDFRVVLLPREETTQTPAAAAAAALPPQTQQPT